jgi:Glycosyl hydrolase family 26
MTRGALLAAARVTAIAVTAIAMTAIMLGGCGFTHPSSPSSPSSPSGPPGHSASVASSGPVHASLPVSADHYLGVFERASPGSYKSIVRFSRTMGVQPNLALYYSAWFEQFQLSFARAAYSHGAVPIVQLNPDNVSVRSIAKGKFDSYLRSYADQVRSYAHPVVIGFAHEPNGPWFRWGWTHLPPKIWIAAWRHIVNIFRGVGADNVTWMWTVNRDGDGTGPLRDYWPGRKYVTWIGIDGYYTVPSDEFPNIFGPTIADIRRFSHRPVLVAETAAGQLAGQAAKIPNLFAGAKASHVLGFVWFDTAQSDPPYHQDWRLEGHPASVEAFRQELRGYR